MAADAADLVEVEYEALPCIVDPFKAMAPDAPVIREDSRTRPRARTARASTTTTSSPGRSATRTATDAAFANADVTIKELISYQRCIPARSRPAMRRLLRQDQGRAHGLGHVPGAARHPHRRLADLEDPRAQDPRHRARHRRRLRQQGRRLFRLYLRDRRLDRDRPAGEVGRGPHRESLDHGLRARLPHDGGDRRHQGRQGDGLRVLYHRRPWRVRRLRRPDQMAGRVLQHRHRLVRLPGRACASVDGVYTNKAPGGVAYRCSFRVTEAAYCIERAMDIMAQKLGMDPAEFRMKNLIRREQFPYTSALGWEYDSGDYQTALQQGDGDRRLSRSCAPSRRPSRRPSGAARRAS